MKITHLALLTISLALTACASDTTKDSKTPAKTNAPAKTPGSNPMPGTAGNPIPPSRNGEYNGVDPMSNGVDGKMYNKNY